VVPPHLPAIFKPGHLRTTPDDRGASTSPRKSSPRMCSPRLGMPVMGGSCIVDTRGALADKTKAERWQQADRATARVMPRNTSDDRLPGDLAKSAIVRVRDHFYTFPHVLTSSSFPGQPPRQAAQVKGANVERRA
jgi:hypothetical protein